MTCGITVRCKNGNALIIPDLGPMEVPRVGQTITVAIGGEVVTVRVTHIRRHYLGDDIVHVIEGEEV